MLEAPKVRISKFENITPPTTGNANDFVIIRQQGSKSEAKTPRLGRLRLEKNFSAKVREVKAEKNFLAKVRLG
jgi:hypothetical protein